MTPRFAELFWRQVGRPALWRPGLSLLNIASIALGVAVFLAVQIANRGATASFRSSVELTTGRADLEVRGAIDDALLPRVAGVAGVRAAAPMVEGIVPLVEPRGEYLRIAGVDPFAAGELLSFRLVNTDSEGLDLERWLAEPGAVATSPAQAARMRDWSDDGQGTVAALAGTSVVRLAPLFEMVSDQALAQAEPRFAAMDIGWAQELLGMPGRLTSIQILLEEGVDLEAVAAAIRQVVPPDVTVAEPAARNDEMRAMMGAFQLNLTAMSLVSVVVGMFLIYNSVSAAVVRRQRQIAILRATGTSRIEIRGLFLGEALVEAALGAGVGIVVAPALAGFVAAPVEGAVSSLYELVRVNLLEVTAGQVVMGLGVGLGAALVAAWRPASEAAGIDPARILHAGAPAKVFAPRMRRLAPLSLLALVLAFLTSWAALSGGPPWLGFVSAALVVAGFSLLVPWFAEAAARFGPLGGLTGRLASDHLMRSLHRNAVTIAALAAAVSMSVAVAVMIHSFRGSVARWIGQTLTADVYVAPAANEIGGLHAFLPEGADAWAQAHPATQSVATFREIPITISGHAVSLAVIEGRARGELAFLPGSLPDASERIQNGDAVALSESYVSRFGLPGKEGGLGELELATPAGIRKFPVCGIYRDFTRDRGTILMPRRLFQSAWDDARLHSLAIEMSPGFEVEEFSNAFRTRFGQNGEIAIYDNAALRERIFAIFEQTFSVTAALRAIAVVVAVAGIAFSLSILAAERSREIGVLRAVGASRSQVLGIFLGEAALLGIASALAGITSGAVLAMVLTWVVNKAFFGWTIALAYPLLPLVLTPVWLVLVSVLAALVPAWRAAGTSPAAAVRFE